MHQADRGMARATAEGALGTAHPQHAEGLWLTLNVWERSDAMWSQEAELGCSMHQCSSGSKFVGWTCVT